VLDALSFLKFVYWLDLQVPGEIVHTWSFSCYYKLCWCLASFHWLEILIHVWWVNHCIKSTRFCLSERYLADGKVKTVTKVLGYEGSRTGDRTMLVVHQGILVVPKMI